MEDKSELVSNAEFDCAAETKRGQGGKYWSHWMSFKNAARSAGITDREEASKFLAHTCWESDGFSKTKEEFCQDPKNWKTCEENYGSNTKGVIFYGRGIIQTTGEANYRAASKALFGNESVLYIDPDLVAGHKLAWASAGAYWRENVHGDVSSFGNTLFNINGKLECDGGKNSANMKLRFEHYKKIRKCMGLSDPPENDGYCHVNGVWTKATT